MVFSQLSVVLVLTILFTGCFGASSELRKKELRVLVESSPASLDPRQSFDAIGQRLEMLMFRGLTSLDENLNPVPDLSEKWRSENAGKRVVFTIRSGLRDHANQSITPALVFQCLRNYLFDESSSLHRSSFPSLRDLRLSGDELHFELQGADPYLERNLSSLRYFTVVGDPENPCRVRGVGEDLVTNGAYSSKPYPERLEKEIRLVAIEASRPDLVFEVVPDETSRLLKLVNHEGDAALNSFSPSKTEWISKKGSHGFQRIERIGTNVSYLAFNLRDPILKNRNVRLAIASAIDRDSVLKFKLRGQATRASSFLSPALPEAMPPEPFSFEPEKSKALLDAAGFPIRKDGFRFSLKYKTTTSREGLELAQVFREQLAQIGVRLELEPVEPSVFFASIRQGHFQIYMSRWVGIADGSILHRTLRTGVKDNRVGFSDPSIDTKLDQSVREPSLDRRRALLVPVQARMLEDLPYFPLWTWTNTLILSDRFTPPKPEALSLSGSFFPLRDLRFKISP